MKREKKIDERRKTKRLWKSEWKIENDEVKWKQKDSERKEKKRDGERKIK